MYTSVAETEKGIYIYSKVLKLTAQGAFTLLWVQITMASLNIVLFIFFIGIQDTCLLHILQRM